MDLFYQFISTIGFILDIIAVLIALLGVLISIFEFLKKELLRREDSLELNEAIQLKLSSYLVLSLEFLIAGDIIKTIVTPTWQGLGVLGAIIAIRTILRYFLVKNLKPT